MQKIVATLFYLGIVLCLLQVWLPAYYLTGDGPCHVYNARILHDLWIGKDVGFYSRFYTLSHEPNPNWFTHILLAVLMFLVNGVVAEKILLSLYVVAFCTGFRKLVGIIKSGDSYMVLLVFILVFNQAVAKGFYNFSISTALFFWVVWSYLYFLQHRTVPRFILVTFLTTLTFFAHPVGFTLSCVATWGILLVTILQGRTKGVQAIGMGGVLLAISQLPSALLLLRFVNGQGGAIRGIQLYKERLDSLVHFQDLICYNHNEVTFATLSATVLFVLFLAVVIWRSVKHRRLTVADGLLIPLLFALTLYFIFPDWLLGGGMLRMRMEIFVFLLLGLYVATSDIHRKVHFAGGVLFFVLFAGISIARAVSISEASGAVTDLVSVCPYIRPYSIVLPLNFAPNGKTEHGGPIADRSWIFTHAQEYDGVYMPLIMLENYEANTGYFPLTWKDTVNPFQHLNKEEGLESTPPYADLEHYKRNAGVIVDNIILWGYDTSFLTQGHIPQLMQQLNANYTIVYTSPSGRTILYKHK